MSSRLIAVAALIGLPLSIPPALRGQQGAEILGSDPGRLTLVNVLATRVSYRGRDAIKVVARPESTPATPGGAPNTIAIIRDFKFGDGTIEADIAGIPATGADTGPSALAPGANPAKPLTWTICSR